jgi:mannose-6-phosphate isomerase-like protein (cupin superfamily)
MECRPSAHRGSGIDQMAAAFRTNPTSANSPHSSDPAKKRPHVMYARRPGSFPKHWHVSAENLVVISGTVVIDEDGREQALHPGDYVYIPVKRVHWGSCPEPCMFFLSIDGPDSFNMVEDKK